MRKIRCGRSSKSPSKTQTIRGLTAAGRSHDLRLVRHQEVDLILVDIFMPDMDGLKRLQLPRKTRPACKLIVMSGDSAEGSHLDMAKRLGVHTTRQKPFRLQELLDTVSAPLRG